MPIIDFHTHAFPDKVAARAMASIETPGSWDAHGDGTVGGLLASMDAADIDVSVVCPIATRPGQVKGILKWARAIRSERIEPFCSVHPDDRNVGKWLAKFAGAGIRGIKLHPMYQDFAVDEERMGPLYQAATDCRLIVEFHCGKDIAFGCDDDRAAPARFARVFDRFAEMLTVCSHMGGWLDWDEGEKHIIGRDVMLETSFSLGEQGTDSGRVADMIRRHGVQRVMFGTDWPWADQKLHVKLLGELDLTEADKQAIYFNNATKLLGY